MRALLVLAAMLPIVALAGDSTLGSFVCPSSNPNPTGCYCTRGCAVQDDSVPGFVFTAPLFPPAAVDKSTIGSDTICAKITVTRTNDTASTALAAWLGVDSSVAAANSEVTIWTAFTKAQCAIFAGLAKIAVASQPISAGLYVNVCNTESCNTVNLPVTRATPAIADNKPSLLPGACPLSNQAPTSCYCTNGCSINGDTSFPWNKNLWPAPSTPLGSDTICAKITVPIYTAVAAGINVDAYLGVNGDITRTGKSTYFGGADGMTVTTYTGFTAAECANFVTNMQALTSTKSVQLDVILCNTSNCNGPMSTNPSASSAFSFATPLFMMTIFFAAVLSI